MNKQKRLSNKSELLKEIEETRKKLVELELLLHDKEPLVKAPKEFMPLIKSTTERIQYLHSDPKRLLNKGMITIDNDRYVMMRAESISYDFIKTVEQFYKSKNKLDAFQLSSSLLYDLSNVLGKEDAKQIKSKLNFETPLELLTAGPINFAFTGWATVEFLPGCNPVPTQDFFLKYIHHNSFEAQAWLTKNQSSEHPVCVWNAGYAAGWCAESMGIELVAVELECEAMGHDNCLFIMAPPDKIEHYIAIEVKNRKLKHKPLVPHLFYKQLREEQLIENDNLLNEALKSSKIGLFKLLFEDQKLFWSDELYRIFEVDTESSSEELNAHYYSSIPSDSKRELQQKVEHLISSGESYFIKHMIELPSNKRKWVKCSGIPVFDSNNKIIGVSGIVREITHRVTEGRDLDIFFDLSVDLQCIASDEGYFIKASPSWSKLLGYSMEELTTQPFTNFVHPDDLQGTYEEMGTLNDGALSVNFENRYITKSGKIVFINWNSKKDEMTNLYYCSARDVTEERLKREELLSDLSEKEILLREIHHRVKNNLQIISSLLSLQSGNNKKNKELKKLYEDSQNRIKSMAAIHELFYQSDALDKIDFSNYIYKLSNDLVNTFKGERNNISININVKKVFLNLDTAVPLGLIINEIISNALKHGIQGDNKGELMIHLLEVTPSFYKLKIGDNGVGIPKGVDISTSESLGFTLITSLIEQLDGNYKLTSSSKGTLYDIEFYRQK
jgi:PAS domain S-box-containing protein